ncbi:MAG: hypothetical protein K9H49_14730 [Bacteroidales bacterium]|nr:hypothetical protein [Bacteroidales bacterium]MCF8390556.1 hypothetical protein [Bacteroidales bacterium]
MGFGGTMGLFIGSKDATLFFTAKRGTGVMLNGYSVDKTYYRNLRGEALLSADIMGLGKSFDIGTGKYGAAFSFQEDPKFVTPSKYAAGTFSLSGPYTLQLGGAFYDTYTVPLFFGSSGQFTTTNIALIIGAFKSLEK